MMTCRECAELLLEFLEGDLDAESADRLRSHLQHCPPCEIFIETYRITIQMSRKLPCADLPPDVAQRLWAAIQACQEEEEG